MNDLNNSYNLLNNAEQEKQDTLVCQGCVLYKVRVDLTFRKENSKKLKTSLKRLKN